MLSTKGVVVGAGGGFGAGPTVPAAPCRRPAPYPPGAVAALRWWPPPHPPGTGAGPLSRSGVGTVEWYDYFLYRAAAAPGRARHRAAGCRADAGAGGARRVARRPPGARRRRGRCRGLPSPAAHQHPPPVPSPAVLQHPCGPLLLGPPPCPGRRRQPRPPAAAPGPLRSPPGRRPAPSPSRRPQAARGTAQHPRPRAAEAPGPHRCAPGPISGDGPLPTIRGIS